MCCLLPLWTPKGRFRGSPHPILPPSPPPPPGGPAGAERGVGHGPPSPGPPRPPPWPPCVGGALAPGVPPGPMAYGLRALGGLAATLGDTQTVSGGGFGARVSPRGRRFLVSPVKSDLEVPQKDHF